MQTACVLVLVACAAGTAYASLSPSAAAAATSTALFNATPNAAAFAAYYANPDPIVVHRVLFSSSEALSKATSSQTVATANSVGAVYQSTFSGQQLTPPGDLYLYPNCPRCRYFLHKTHVVAYLGTSPTSLSLDPNSVRLFIYACNGTASNGTASNATTSAASPNPPPTTLPSGLAAAQQRWLSVCVTGGELMTPPIAVIAAFQDSLRRFQALNASKPFFQSTVQASGREFSALESAHDDL